MVQREVVSEVHADLKAMHAELVRNRENPHMIRLIRNMMRLTNLGEDMEESPTVEEIQGGAAAGPELVTAKPTPENCKHILNVYGQCILCGQCQHTQIRNGVCITCGETEGSKSA